ncbi:hypothetical protein [Streptomyces asiaticus]|uniref:hypothetical protein n=1 Tax=Streptomyces asiaticus TaxID=114695 RepID=UPI0038048C04
MTEPTTPAPQPDRETDVMTPQQCPKGLHADWMVDSEHAHACPWCELDQARAELGRATRAFETLMQKHDKTKAERDELLDELGGREDEARERWIQKQLDEIGIRSMDFRNGVAMDIEPARELCAHFVGAARAMLGDAPNYSETKLEFDVKVAESPELYTFVVQRHGPGVLTPHDARQKAEAERDEVLRIVSDWCTEANDVGGVDATDLAFRLERAGHPLPDEEDASAAAEGSDH